jgi:branched-chain amino acid transport system substrate-binding protein
MLPLRNLDAPKPAQSDLSLVRLALGLAVVVAVGGCTAAPPTGTPGSGAGSSAPSPASPSGNAFTIGIAVAQTSNVALLGQEQVSGARIAETYFNQNGGINGAPLTLVFQDTGGDEAGAINAFQTLINQSNVLGIVGPTLSQQAFGADPIADRAGVPVLAPSNTAKGIPQIGDFITRVSAPVAVVPESGPEH